MVTELRRAAEAEAQRACKAMLDQMVANGLRLDPLLGEAYRAAERVVDAVDDLEHALDAITQRDDPEAPDYSAWSESEMAGAWGR